VFGVEFFKDQYQVYLRWLDGKRDKFVSLNRRCKRRETMIRRALRDVLEYVRSVMETGSDEVVCSDASITRTISEPAGTA